MGEGCLIGANAELRGGVKVYPYKVVEAGAQVQSSIVWESGGTRTLFGREGVRGIVNVDISPELAVRLAKAWASSLEKGSVITTSRDTSRAARVLKRALMVGCNSVGVNVTDLEVATIPVTRHHIRTRGTQGGLTVRLSPDDPQSVAIRFFDSDGLDLSEGEQRRIERLYHREEFRRVTAGDIGDIDFSPARWSTTRPTWSRPSICPTPPGATSSWCWTSPTARPASSCPTSCPRSRRTC